MSRNEQRISDAFAEAVTSREGRVSRNERRGIIKRGTYYRRLREAGDIRLKEIWGMEAAGVRFTDEDLLAMFGR